MSRPHISIVIPVYQAEDILPELIFRLENILNKINTDFEIILVEDVGTDNSWQIIKKLSVGRPYLKGIKLCKNFGQHYAITTGLHYAKGDWIVVMDCDLQDLPEEIEKLYTKAKQGYDVVFAKRQKRKDRFFKRLSSYLFAKCFNYFTNQNHDHRLANFGIYSRKSIETLLMTQKQQVVFPAMLSLFNFRQTKINVKHGQRLSGRSSYSFIKLIKLTLFSIFRFIKTPKQLIKKLGRLILFLSIILNVFYILLTFFKVSLIDFTTYIGLSITLILICSIFALGIIVLYIFNNFAKPIVETSKNITQTTNL